MCSFPTACTLQTVNAATVELVTTVMQLERESVIIIRMVLNVTGECDQTCKSGSQIDFNNKFYVVTLILRVDLNSYSFPLASEDQFATTKNLPSVETSP